MKATITIVLCVIFFQLFSQAPYVIFDPDDASIRNYVNDFKVKNDSAFIVTTQFCPYTDSVFAECTSIIGMNLKNNTYQTFTNELFTTAEDNNCLSLSKKGISILGNRYEIGNSNFPVVIQNLSPDLELKKELNILTPKNYDWFLTRGILQTESTDYYYGSYQIKNGVRSSGIAITKINRSNGKEIWHKTFKPNLKGDLYINDFNKISDTSLIFITYYKPVPGPGDPATFTITKIDTSGTILQAFEAEVIIGQKPRLMYSFDGHAYFASRDNKKMFTLTAYGCLNKISKDFSQIEWSAELPNNQLVDGRSFRTEDIIETQDKNILICGMTRDDTDSEVLGSDINTSWCAFIAKYDPLGNMIFLKIFKVYNNLLSHKDYGKFRASVFNKVIETEEGDLLLAGSVFVTSVQANVTLGEDYESYHVMVMKLNKNGCLEGHGCDEVTKIHVSKPATPKFNIGTKWTYETMDDDNIGLPISFVEYLITDTVIWNGRKAFVIENSLGGFKDYMWVDGSKAAMWDERLMIYSPTYDFDETDQYFGLSKFDVSQPQFDTATFVIDSIRNYTIDKVDIQAQHLHIEDGVGFRQDLPQLVYSGIGFDYGGLVSGLDGSVSTGDFYINKIRCFENDSLKINFVRYPCDSTWNTTSTHTLESRNIVLHPNPTSGQIYFDGLDQEYRFEVFDMSGKKIVKGITKHHSLLLSDKGMYYLRLFVKDRWLGQTVVVE